MAITKVSPDVVNFDSALVVSPTLTIGDATAEDTKIVFDGNAQDYYIGLDDSADDLVIGLGSVVGGSPAIVIDENLNVGVGVTPTVPLHVDGAQAYASSATNLSTTVSKAAFRMQGSSDSSTSLFMGALTNDAQMYVQSSNGAGSAADDIILNPFGGSVGIGVGNASPDRIFHAKRSDSGGTVAKFENSAGTVYIELNTANQAGGDAGYLSYDSSKNLGLWTDDTQRVTIDSAGTFRVGNPAGVPTPGSGWDANLDAIQVGEASAFRSGDSDYSAATVVSTNIYQTGGGDKLLNGTDFAAQYLQQGGNHYFYGYNNGSADATPAVDANDNANPLIIYKGGGISLSGGSVSSTNNGKAGIFWHGNPANGADYCIRRTNDAWSGSNYAQLLIDWDTGVKIDVGNSAYGKSYLEVNGNIKFSASGQGIDFSETGSGTSTSGQAHVLDEYEFGSWTPTCHTGSATFVSPYYIKIGRVVHFSFQVHQFTDTSTASSIDIRGLPFPCLVGQAAGTVFGIYLDTEVDSVYVNTAEEIFFYELTNSSWYAAQHGDINSSSAYFYVGGTYITSS